MTRTSGGPGSRARRRPPPLLALLWLASLGCATGTAARAPRGPLAPVEASYQVMRWWDDQWRLLGSRGVDLTPAGLTRAAMRDSLESATAALERLLQGVDGRRLAGDDRRALGIMRETLRSRPTPDPGNAAQAAPAEATGCRPAPDGTSTVDELTATTIACYGEAASRIALGRDTLNRLAVLGAMSREPDPARRQSLFLALEPTWRSVNGDNTPVRSPFRRLVRLRRAAWVDGASPIERKGSAFGLSAADLEAWLLRALAAWRHALPDTLIEPWDWYYANGEATRALSPRLPDLLGLLRVNHAFYTAMGADPARLRIHYDLEARPGKYPVAFTDIGSRNRWSASGALQYGEPWVFTSYLSGNFDNLTELLHETGHAIHLAAIRTRPAYMDWPDDDTFTEALADVPALEVYEPAWQWRFLGDSVALRAALRAKYASVMLDMTWALFEIRLHRTPDVDPNALWADLTSTFLGIRPHPEWSWWAMRGQLIDAPGYLINYALGAFLAADIRSRVTALAGVGAWSRPDRYASLAAGLYQFGLERTSREVLDAYLGRPPQPDALLADLQRMDH